MVWAMGLVQAVSEALDAVPLDGRDVAAIELARYQAAAIDDGEPLDKLGPQLLATLDALGLTPKARKAVVKGAGGEQRSPLDELRERRNRRAG